MSGLASRLLTAKRVAVELSNAGSPAANIIQGNEPFYYLGALGPALGDFVPHEEPEFLGDPGRTPYYAVWIKVLEIAVGNPDRGLPGVVPTLRGFREILNEVSTAVGNKDLGALTDIRDSGRLDDIAELSTNLGTILTYFSDPAQLVTFGSLMGSTSRPVLNDPLNMVPAALWTGRDYLSWKKTGDFASVLLDQASDDAQRAYAIGWQVSYATQICMSGYVTSAVGSVYRTHWWRHRWVSNFVDSWLWGFYDADGMDTGQSEAGPFAGWRSLCDAKLNDWIDVTGGAWDYEGVAREMARGRELPAMLPESFTEFWVAAFESAYGTVTPPLFTKERIQTAYAALGTVLWFQTSGDVIGCNPIPGAPPTACNSGDAPAWIDPTQTNPATGAPFEPPTPNAEHQPDVAKIISGIILAILGIVSAALGGFVIGATALAGGIVLIVDGIKQANWDELTCDLYWIDVYLFNGLEALHRLTLFGGLQHPYPRDLDVDELVLAFNGASLPFASGPAVIRSRGIDAIRQPWSGAISTWAEYANEPIEIPVHSVFSFGSDHWPKLVFDDDTTNPLLADLMTPPPAWPGGNIDRTFGPAVQNAIKIIDAEPGELPNWNLDGDRGFGWLTWTLNAPYSVPVNAVPDP